MKAQIKSLQYLLLTEQNANILTYAILQIIWLLCFLQNHITECAKQDSDTNIVINEIKVQW